MKPEPQQTLPSHASAWALPLGLVALTGLAGAAQQKAPAPLPHADADAAKAPWYAPAKDGVHGVGLERLPLPERAAYDAAVRRSDVRGATSAGVGAKDVDAPATPTFHGTEAVLSHFQIDTPGDGAVWVHGGTYKARFGADGASYIPFFGSAAPRNFPVTFRVDAVTSGGDPIVFERDAAPAITGRRVAFERGALRERYDVAPGQVEQSFEFASLPGTGALVVELALATTFVDGELHITVPASFLADATLPLVIDPVITTWSVAPGTTDDFQSDIAYDASQNRFLVVYERAFSATDHDVWSELFAPSNGAPIAGSGVYIDFTGSSWETPRCANNRIASQFLVVASRRGTPAEIWGRTREAEDATVGNQFQVSVNGGSGDKLAPDVGGDPELAGPTYYCVVWERALIVGVDHDIHAQLVTTAGTNLTTSVILVDNTGSTYDRVPTVSKHNGLAPFSNHAWNLAWNRLFNANDWDIRGAQLRWDGAVQTASFSVDFSGSDHRSPEVSASLTPTADGRPYLVVYEEFTPSRVEIEARLLSGSNYLGGVDLSQALGTPSGLNDVSPAVETDGNHFAVTWSQQFALASGDYDMYAAGLYYADSTLHVSESATNLAFSGTFEGNGRITALYGAGYTSTWFGVSWTDSAGVGNIEAATYALPEGFGPFIGARYCSPAVPNSTGVPGRIEAQGAGYAGGRPLHLVAYGMPQNVFCYFLASPASASTTTPATSGVVCVGNPLSRFNGAGQVGNTGSAGRIELGVNTLAIPRPTGGTFALTAGTTFHFQAWYRDGATNNLTDAVAVLFR